MRRLLGLGLVVVALAACAGAPDPAPATQSTAPPVSGVSVVSVIGTPFLIIFKIPVCILTLVVAGPVAGISELSDPDTAGGADVRRGLSDGIATNCGPPYVVSP